MSAQPASIADAKPLHAERWVVRDEYGVMLTIDPVERGSILGQLLRALARDKRLIQVLTAGRLAPSDPMFGRALADMLAGSAGSDNLWMVTLTPAQATALAEDLDALATEPDRCCVGSCSSYEDTAAGYCADHEEALR